MQQDYHLTLNSRGGKKKKRGQPPDPSIAVLIFSWSLPHYDACEVIMSALKHVILQDKDQDVEKRLDWSYIEWDENEDVSAGVANAETQTDRGPFEDKECQTSNPVIMHIDLTRTNSKLRHSSLVDGDGLVAPFFQFDRQAPGRISTSPTLRRMRSTRRPLTDSWDPLRMGSTQEEPSTESTPSPVSPHRVKSPLAASPLSDGETGHDHQSVSSSDRQRTRSHRSKTFDNGLASKRQECHSAHPAHRNSNFGFPDSEAQVRRLLSPDMCCWESYQLNGHTFLPFLSLLSPRFRPLPPAVVADNASFWQQMNQQLHALTAPTKPTAPGEPWEVLSSGPYSPQSAVTQ